MNHIHTENELKYQMVKTCLSKQVERGLLTEGECEIANRHNAMKYKPLFVEI